MQCQVVTRPTSRKHPALPRQTLRCNVALPKGLEGLDHQPAQPVGRRHVARRRALQRDVHRPCTHRAAGTVGQLPRLLAALAYSEAGRTFNFCSSSSNGVTPLTISKTCTLSLPGTRRPSRYAGVLERPRPWAILTSSRIPATCRPLDRHFWKAATSRPSFSA